MTDIKNYNVYTERMEKGMEDKLFWVRQIPDNIENIVDFGCADGRMLSVIKQIFPNANLYGVENNEALREMAKINCPAATYVSNTGELPATFGSESSCLILSSVIHEIYSYCSEEERKQISKDFASMQFDYIVIRDFCVSNETRNQLDPYDQAALMVADQEQIIDFEKYWGLIKTKKDLIHYLLKYKYVENWDREVRENYLPISIEELLNMITQEYQIEYFNHYVLPYTSKQICMDFGYLLKENTHIKLLLKRTH